MEYCNETIVDIYPSVAKIDAGRIPMAVVFVNRNKDAFPGLETLAFLYLI